MNVIVAPHPDDELIGCYKVLSQGKVDKVIYMTGDEQRRLEAMLCAEYFGFKPVFSNKRRLLSDIGKPTILYLPSRKDMHPDHKYANKVARKVVCTKIYYSVDKNIPYEVLSDKGMKTKESLLNMFYPSQSKLWENDKKYVFFEGYRKQDYEMWAIVKFRFEAIHSWKTIPKKHPEWYLQHPHRHEFHCEVWVSQSHNDRDVEYLKLKHELKQAFYDNHDYLQGKSCEMMSEVILNWVRNKYPNRQYRIKITEDGENGAFLDDTDF
jgi:hypothetical protein